jgi:hypothetical protein
LAAAPGRKPAALHLHLFRGSSSIREPHFAQLRQPGGKISQDFSGDFAAETAGAQNFR